MRERIDEIGGGLKLIQREKQFALGTDAVLFSKFVSLRTNDRVIDLGAGAGSISLLLAARKKQNCIVALELQPELADLCRRSVEINKLGDSIQVINGDIRKVRTEFLPETFDLVTCNPPYAPITGSLVNAEQAVAIARHELCCQLADVVQAAAWLVRFGGRVALVHRPQRLGDIFCSFREQSLEPKRIQFVHPRPAREANIVLIEATKGAKPGLRTLPPLILRGDDDV